MTFFLDCECGDFSILMRVNSSFLEVGLSIRVATCDMNLFIVFTRLCSLLAFGEFNYIFLSKQLKASDLVFSCQCLEESWTHIFIANFPQLIYSDLTCIWDTTFICSWWTNALLGTIQIVWNLPHSHSMSFSNLTHIWDTTFIGDWLIAILATIWIESNPPHSHFMSLSWLPEYQASFNTYPLNNKLVNFEDSISKIWMSLNIPNDSSISSIRWPWVGYTIGITDYCNQNGDFLFSSMKGVVAYYGFIPEVMIE